MCAFPFLITTQKFTAKINNYVPFLYPYIHTKESTFIEFSDDHSTSYPTSPTQEKSNFLPQQVDTNLLSFITYLLDNF